MVFFCRICGGRFMRSFRSDDDEILVTICGHLFHKKCLDVSFTHQKLSHATSGTGPFRRFCPAYQCTKEMPENGVIEISTTAPKSPKGDEISEDHDDTEAKLTKKVQLLAIENDKLQQQVSKLENENEGFREVIDEIKAECGEIATFLLDNNMMKKGDRVFWATKERSLAPGRIIEMRRKLNPSKSQENCPFAIIKLDKKIIIPSLGIERETAIVPISEVVTFKSFFKDSFHDFRHKLWKILDESKERATEIGRQRLLRSKFRESCLRLSMDTPVARVSLSGSHEAIDSIALDDLTSPNDGEAQKVLKRGKRISRAKSMYFGMHRSQSQDFDEKHRSTSWTTRSNSNKPSPLSEEVLFNNHSSDSSSVIQSPTFSCGPAGDDDGGTENYITEGEKVIYYDQTSQFPQTGEVECVLKYTPCAIVKFDDLPDTQQIFKYRTVPLVQLFPYALSSPEEKFKIAESYGKIYEFVQEHSDMFKNFDDDPQYSDAHDDEEYFSTSSAEELVIDIVHQV